MNSPISITALSSISSLGKHSDEIWNAYLNNEHYFTRKQFNNSLEYVSSLSQSIEEALELLKNSNSKYKDLDKSVLLAIYTARKTFENTGWEAGDFGINIGSSRGATALFEKYHQDFLKRNKTETLSSPTTTLGNISSWVAHDLQSSGPTISHSITCSTALHSVLNGIAWINSGMSSKFLVGGSEAPLTSFTIAQMKALKIYATCDADLVAERTGTYPCKTLDFSKKKNTMILGEGACILALEKEITKNALAVFEGVGYATEVLEHNISISDDAICFQKSMQMALQNTKLEEVDAIIMHAPGTLKGDTSEYKAIKKIFGESIPMLTSNKWKIGHTFGASGALSLELAILMLQHQQFIDIPFVSSSNKPKQLNKILVNAVGFGGNAVSVLISKN